MADKPSVSSVRKARQNYAIAESRMEMATMKARMCKMEEMIEQLLSCTPKLISQSMPDAKNMSDLENGPPGLENLAELLEKRVSLFERVFVLVDWPALENAARTCKSAEPESELSPPRPDTKSIAEKELYDLADLPPFPVAAPPPLLGAQAQQSQADSSQNLHSMDHQQPACEECCEHPSRPGDKEQLLESSRESLRIQQIMQLIFEKLDSCKLLNS